MSRIEDKTFFSVEAKVHVDKLTRSILAKAFRWELVPQDPDDPPASELLERIREEREIIKTEGKPPKTRKMRTLRKKE